MKQLKKSFGVAGFSLLELLIAMSITLLLLGLVSGLFARALGIRARESRRTDALTSAQAALNVMSREISNSGYGIVYNPTTTGGAIPSNGIIVGESGTQRIHFRANITNEGAAGAATASPGEDVTYFFDDDTKSIVRYDAHGIDETTPLTSVVVNGISEVKFGYFDYVGSSSTPIPNNADGASSPTVNTGRVRITITVTLDPVQGQPNSAVTFRSDVTLRNSGYMLKQY